MQINQLSIFDMPINPNPLPVHVMTSKVVAASMVRDIRTEGQKNKDIAFDVGEKVGGARKDLAKKRAAFLENPTVQLLDELEKTDVTIAAQVIVRDTFFSFFSFEDCRKRGMEPSVAKAIQLFIRRIPKESKDSAEDRRKYVNMLTFLSDLLKTVVSQNEFYSFIYRVRAVRAVMREEEITKCEDTIKANEEAMTYEDDEESLAYLKKVIDQAKVQLFLNEIAQTMAFQEYSGPFKSFFVNYKSREAALNNAFSIKSWDELIPPVSAGETRKKGVKREPVWERQLPALPTRSGGSAIHIDNPKLFIEHFGFRSSEFGHYVDDGKGREHLIRSSEAFTDLADILQIPIQSVSLKNELAMAFGSRGSGRALGHYEPSRKVINLTKEKGSLGILAHEWFHGLDHYLYNASFSFVNGKTGFLTDQEYGDMPTEVNDAVYQLMDTITFGQSTAYLSVSGYENKYRLRNDFKSLYDDVSGDLLRFMDRRLMDFDERVDNALSRTSSSFREKAEAKYARQRSKKIRVDAEALAQYHLERTGEAVEKIPYPVNRSEYYQNAINMDKGKIGKYWSSNIELAARAFECYVYKKLQEKGWTSDYLVCGIRDGVFPQGVDRKRIFYCMEQFIQAIRPFLEPDKK